MPGIYIKYDMSALKVLVFLGRENIVKLIIRMCSVIAGIVVISGFISCITLKVWEKFLKTFAPQVYAISQEKLPFHDPQKTSIKFGKESQTTAYKPNNVNLLTSNIFDSTNPIISLTTK